MRKKSFINVILIFVCITGAFYIAKDNLNPFENTTKTEKSEIIAPKKIEPKEINKISKWKSTNISVYMKTDNPIYQNAYLTAVKIWNNTDLVNFYFVSNEESADVVLTSKDNGETYDSTLVEGRTIGLATNHTDSLNFIVKSKVEFIDNTILNEFGELKYDEEHLVDVALHELGHTLGLDHTSNENSLMYEKASNTPFNYIDEETLTRIKELYKGEQNNERN